MLLKDNSRIKVMEGAKHNLPDGDAQHAAQCIKQLASELTEKDLLLVLISGRVNTQHQTDNPGSQLAGYCFHAVLSHVLQVGAPHSCLPPFHPSR